MWLVEEICLPNMCHVDSSFVYWKLIHPCCVMFLFTRKMILFLFFFSLSFGWPCWGLHGFSCDTNCGISH